MSARSAGRIAAVVTARRVGAGVAPGGTAEVMQLFSAEPQEQQQDEAPTERKLAGASAIPQPARASTASEGRVLNTFVSYIPGEALVLYLIGVAVVAQLHDPVSPASRSAAIWVIFVIALVANAVFFGLAFRDRMRESGADGLDVRQIGPLLAGFVAIELAFCVLALAVPGAVVFWDAQWVPVLLLVGAAIVFAIVKVFCLAPLTQATRDT